MSYCSSMFPHINLGRASYPPTPLPVPLCFLLAWVPGSFPSPFFFFSESPSVSASPCPFRFPGADFRWPESPSFSCLRVNSDVDLWNLGVYGYPALFAWGRFFYHTSDLASDLLTPPPPFFWVCVDCPLLPLVPSFRQIHVTVQFLSRSKPLYNVCSTFLLPSVDFRGGMFTSRFCRRSVHSLPLSTFPTALVSPR